MRLELGGARVVKGRTEAGAGKSKACEDGALAELEQARLVREDLRQEQGRMQ
jgi:hypothetical protein